MLLTEFRGRATAVIDATPNEVFAAITAIDRLPEWNTCIAEVLKAPGNALAEGVEWTVQMAISRPPAKWPSRSRLLTYDPAELVFEHISQSDDGNPTYVHWRWSVAPNPGGARITVEWTGHPKTFWRRLLFARIRRKQLQAEASASLHALADHLGPAGPLGPFADTPAG